MRLYLYITVAFLSIFKYGYSQTTEEKEIPLKIDRKSISTDSLNSLKPAKAAFYSALVPGLGQVYNKKYWKLPIVYGALGTGLYFCITSNTKYQNFREEYKARLQGTNNPNDEFFGPLKDINSIERGMRFYQRNRDLSVLITAGIYILNIIDANVDAHLSQFNVNDNLSLKPNIDTNLLNSSKHDVGFSLTYTF